MTAYIADRIGDQRTEEKQNDQRIYRIDVHRTRETPDVQRIDSIDGPRTERPNDQGIDCLHSSTELVFNIQRKRDRIVVNELTELMVNELTELMVIESTELMVNGQRKRDRMINELTAYIADRISVQRSEKGIPIMIDE